MITSSPCGGTYGPFVFRRRPNRITVWLSASCSIPLKRERSTYRLICMHRSKRQSSHFFARRESRRIKLRLQVSLSDAARRRLSWLAGSGLEFSPLSYLASSMDSMESSPRSEEHTSELQSRSDLVCRLLL